MRFQLITRALPGMIAPAAMLAAMACGESAPTEPAEAEGVPDDIPALEPVDYSILGAGKLLFERQLDSRYVLYLIDADASRSRGLQATQLQPMASLAPGGGSIAFRGVGAAQGEYNFAAPMDSPDRRRISEFVSGVEGPASWSPEGSSVVFMAVSGGSSPAGIYRGVPGAAPSRLHPLSLNVAEEGCPATTPTRRSVAASANGGISFACNGVAAALHAGEELAILYKPSEPDVAVLATAWSPAGSEIAFLERRREGESVGAATWVRVLTVATGALREIAVIDGNDSPSFCILASGPASSEFGGCNSPTPGAPRPPMPPTAWKWPTIESICWSAHGYVALTTGTGLWIVHPGGGRAARLAGGRNAFVSCA
jgi:hypothetical protein